MKMATDNLQNVAAARQAARQKYIEERINPLPNNVDSLNEAHLVSLVKELHKQLAETEEARYDLEMKIRKQDYDVRFIDSLTRRLMLYRLLSGQRIDDQSQRCQRKIH